MVKPPFPTNERARLAALEESGLLGSSPEEGYDIIAQAASDIIGTPIALVSLVDSDWQWLKARLGVDAEQTPRDISFCAHAMLEHGPLVVEDAREDPRFFDSPLVVGELGVRFYAGAAIRTPDGLALGAVCAIDRVPHTPTERQLEVLEWLAKHAAALIEERRNGARPTVD